LEGGIRKYGIARPDLLLRDAACAAAYRSANACDSFGSCPDSAATDTVQVRELIHQAADAVPRAIAEGQLTVGEGMMTYMLLASAQLFLIPPWPPCGAEPILNLVCGMFD
jgi:hypothetical protein